MYKCHRSTVVIKKKISQISQMYIIPKVISQTQIYAQYSAYYFWTKVATFMERQKCIGPSSLKNILSLECLIIFVH